MNNMNVDCSIIIPAYNAEKTIEKAINSIKCSNTSEYIYEIIIVDDGSTDDTVNIVRKIDNRSIKLITKENGGASSARNVGLSYAQGRYIYFMDADDEVYREVLDEMVRIAYEKAVEIVLADYEFYDLDSHTISLSKVSLEPNRIFDRNYCVIKILPSYILKDINGLSTLCNKVFLADTIKKNSLFFDEQRTHGEDWAFNISFFEVADSAIYLDKTLYRYNLDGSQQLSKYKKGLEYGLFNSYDLLYRLIQTYNMLKVDNLILDRMTLTTARGIISLISFDDCSKKDRKRILKRKESIEIFKQLSRIDDECLNELSLSRKDKVAFWLFSCGLYKTALRIYS